MTNTIDIVCPVKDQDWPRFGILYESLIKHLKIDHRIHVISPSGICPIKADNLISYSDCEIIPELIDSKYNGVGWWKQQALKLACFDRLKSETIMILDADCFMVKDMVWSDIVHDNKIKIKISTGGSWDNWYHGSSKILNLSIDYKKSRIGVTPVILSKSIIQGMVKYLTTIHGSPWQYLLSHTSIYDTSFNPPESPTWTEYCLYHIYGVQSELWDKYHINYNIELSGNCFWTSEQSEKWDPSKSFNNPYFFFTVAQSISGKSAEWVKNKIQPFL